MSQEVLDSFNAKRKAAGQAYALDHDGSWQPSCPRCKWTGSAGSLGTALSDCVVHDHDKHS
jgi:hypothetical protein